MAQSGLQVETAALLFGLSREIDFAGEYQHLAVGMNGSDLGHICIYTNIFIITEAVVVRRDFAHQGNAGFTSLISGCPGNCTIQVMIQLNSRHRGTFKKYCLYQQSSGFVFHNCLLLRLHGQSVGRFMVEFNREPPREYGGIPDLEIKEVVSRFQHRQLAPAFEGVVLNRNLPA